MSLVTPTTKQVSDNIIAQLESSFNQTIPLLQKAFFRVLSKVLGGVFVLLYKYGGFMFLQMFVQTASIKDTSIIGVVISPLKFWGRLIGVGDPVAAISAELIIDITVNNQIGILPSGSQLINASNGVTYATLAAVSLNASIVQVNIIAVSDQAGGGGVGVIGNLVDGAVVSFANALANVNRNTLVASTTVTGADAEATEVYRQRIIDRFQKRPQGGAYADYEIWGEEVAGIVNVYPYTSTNPGQVDVYVEATVASSGNPDGIPTVAQLQAVLDSIDFNDAGLASRRPANALANTFPITRTNFTVEITGLVVDNQATVQATVTTALEEYFLERDLFINGLSVLPRLDRITASAIGGIVEDIVSAEGGVFASLVVKEGGTPFTIRTLVIGEKAKTNSVIFI